MADIRRLPGTNADVWDWQMAGNCRGLDSSLFFHPDGERGPSRSRREREAKAVCGTCPVRAQCAAHALKVHEPYGVWGGLSESERQQLINAGWEDLADRRRRRVDLTRLEARLHHTDQPALASA
ncbi:MAG: WhiB family transcriptional regulator [Actinocatenispora sp.]